MLRLTRWRLCLGASSTVSHHHSVDWRDLLCKALQLPPSEVPARPSHLSVYSYSMSKWIEREHFDHPPMDSKARRSAVLILLAPPPSPRHSSDLCFSLTMRSSKMRAHAGQMSLPGGKCDGNELAEDAAARETEEEIGICRSQYEILGSLPQVWSYPGRCWITPVVGLAEKPLEPHISSPDEVESLYFGHLGPLLFESQQTHFRLEKHYSINWGGRLTMPCFLAPPSQEIDMLMMAPDVDNVCCAALDLDPMEELKQERRSLEAFAGNHGLVWGLTALMISNLLVRLAHPSVANQHLVGAPLIFADPEKKGDAKDGGG